MVNFEKSQPPPPSLAKEKKKANGKYNGADVLERIKTDFKNKCYICEAKAPHSINVEHFIPHRGDKDLKFDWKNLFYACAHCNNIKSDKFDNILDCTDPEHDVENWIRYRMNPLPLEPVMLTALKENDRVAETVLLLDAVYAGTTPQKRLESGNIRNALLDELLDFNRHLYSYYCEDLDDEEKVYTLRKIKKHLKKSSPFTAFKRWVIKEHPVRKKDFQQYFD